MSFYTTRVSRRSIPLFLSDHTPSRDRQFETLGFQSAVIVPVTRVLPVIFVSDLFLVYLSDVNRFSLSRGERSTLQSKTTIYSVWYIVFRPGYSGTR